MSINASDNKNNFKYSNTFNSKHHQMITTASVSSVRREAQQRMLSVIKKKYAPRMRTAARFLLHAVRDALEVENELKEEFVKALGTDNHELIAEATFETSEADGAQTNMMDIKDFAKDVIAAAEWAIYPYEDGVVVVDE
jgi:hypothetical protein